jgi:hypothetical protein
MSDVDTHTHARTFAEFFDAVDKLSEEDQLFAAATAAVATAEPTRVPSGRLSPDRISSPNR